MKKLIALLIGPLMACMISRSAEGQIPKAGDRDSNGRVYTKIVATITGESGAFGHPVSDLLFLVVTESGDRASVRTNDAGVASTWLTPGSYRLVNPDAYQWKGTAYTWDVIVSVKSGTGVVRLSQSNATKIASVSPQMTAPQPLTTSSVSATASAAQATVNSVTQGFFLAPHLLGTSLTAEGEPTESGGGFGLSLGYGFTRLISGFFTVDVATIDIRDPDIEGNYNLGHGDLGIRFNFRDQAQKAVPYAQAAFTARVAQTTIDGTDIEISGPGFTLGGGLHYYFQPKLALDIGLSYTSGKFDTIKIDGDEVPADEFNATGARFQIGITWFPFAQTQR